MSLDAMDRIMSRVVTAIGRMVYAEPRLDDKNKQGIRSYDGEWNPRESRLEDEGANLVSSELGDAQQPGGRRGRLGRGERMHAPAIDLDVPCHLVASSTPGHFHLYIDKPMPWSQYRDLLRAMRACGLIEDGFLISAESRSASFLRLPHIKKKVTP